MADIQIYGKLVCVSGDLKIASDAQIATAGGPTVRQVIAKARDALSEGITPAEAGLDTSQLATAGDVAGRAAAAAASTGLFRIVPRLPEKGQDGYIYLVPSSDNSEHVRY